MAAMEWTDKLALGLGPMDGTHQEFVDAYNRLVVASGEALLIEMDAFIAHTVDHFDQENRWMELIGFPGCHKAEHDRVLAVCRDVRKRMERGDAALGRHGEFVAEFGVSRAVLSDRLAKLVAQGATVKVVGTSRDSRPASAA